MPEISVTVSQQQDKTSSEVAIRNHRVLMDRPEAKGGGDAGPMGGEMLLASLGGCFMSNLIAASRVREIPARGLSVEVTGEMGGTPARFQRVRMVVAGPGMERQELEKLVVVAERGCVVANTLSACIDLEVSIP